MGQPRRSPRELLNLDRVTAHDHNVSKSPLANNATHADNGMCRIKVAHFRFETFSLVTWRYTGWDLRVNPGGCP
jgi:hypothetical protein